MNELAAFIQQLKTNTSRKKQDPTAPARYWSEPDMLQGKVVDAFVIIFRTFGCSWASYSGCTMCGYFTDSCETKVSSEDMLHQFECAMHHYKGESIAKIFTSGSFFDDHEIDPLTREKIFRRLSKTTKKISVESRPEYVTDQTIDEMKSWCEPSTIEIGIGLETASDVVREYTINKGFCFKDYQQAATTIHKKDGEVKTYVLVKPPFLTEHEALHDCVHTVKKIAPYTDTISFNPVNVQRGTVVEYLWRRHQYRPPWLWTIVDILHQSSQNAKQKRLACDVVGGGSIRGAHNCRTCDTKVLQAIKEFSLTQDIGVFDALDCSCKEKWRDQLSLESLSYGSLIDTLGGFHE